jgi:hypothetical protein
MDAARLLVAIEGIRLINLVGTWMEPISRNVILRSGS